MSKRSAIILSLLGLFAVAEIAARVIGMDQFPIYRQDSEIKYFLAPNQRGDFLGHDYYTNEIGLPLPDTFDKNIHPSILLIGNSIIYGGNVFKQKEKLFTVLQDEMPAGQKLWPVALGGWTQVNEMAFLKRHDELIANADGFAWLYMSGGLTAATPWAGEYAFPTARPVCVSCYAVLRYGVIPLLPKLFPNELPIRGAVDPVQYENFIATIKSIQNNRHYKYRSIIWLYPIKTELEIAKKGGDWLPERKKITSLAADAGITVIDIAASPLWTASLYRADGVHPTAEGNRALAKILHDALIN